MDNPPKDWGMEWEPHIKYIGDYCCLNCGHDFIDQFNDAGDRVSYYKNIVGFSKSCPDASYGVVGMFIVDCPKCQSKFWFHAHTEMSIELARDTCPNWPRDEQGQPL